MTKPTPKIRLLPIIIIIAFLSGVAAFYMTTPPSGNPDDAVSEQENADSSSSIAASPYSGYATGNLKKMVFHKTPKTFKELSFFNAAGESVGLDVFAGNYVVLNFWATWCVPCREEMPSLDLLQNYENLNNLKIFPINVGQDNYEKSLNFFKDLRIQNLKLYFDSPITLAKKFGLRGIPTSILFNNSFFQSNLTS